MKETSLKPVIEKLESLFSKFNEKFYNNELQTPRYHGKPGHNKGCLWVVYRLEGVDGRRTEKDCRPFHADKRGFGSYEER